MGTYNTEFGPIFYDSTGNDHRSNIRDSRPRFSTRHEAAKLQKPALRAFREAEKRLGRRLGRAQGWRKTKARAIQLTGSWRSFDLQHALYSQDSSRFASPYTSGHVQGIAIDVSTNDPHFAIVGDILRGMGWEQARQDDEPWHFTWGPKV